MNAKSKNPKSHFGSYAKKRLCCHSVDLDFAVLNLKKNNHTKMQFTHLAFVSLKANLNAVAILAQPSMK